MPALVLASLDLAPLTGGATQPALQVEPWALAGVAGGLLLAAGVAAAVAAAAGRRSDPAVLRAGDDH